MLNYLTDTLFKKIILSISLILVLILAALFLILPAYLEDYFIAIRREELLDKGRILISFTAEDKIDSEQLLNLAEELVDTNLLVLDQQGVVIEEGSRMSRMRGMDRHHQNHHGRHQSRMERENGQQVYDLKELSEQLGDLFEKNLISFSGDNPFLAEDVVGVGITTDENILFLIAPIADLRATIYEIRNLTLQIIAVAFLLALLLSSLISRGITRPLTKIKSQVKEMAQGNFDVRVKQLSNDEIGQLAVGFNYLADQLKENVKTLQNERDRMEQMLEAMGEGVLGVSKAKEVIFSNQTLLEILALEAGFNYQDFKQELALIKELVAEIIKNKEAIKLEFEQGDKIILAHGAPIISEQRLQGVIILFRDITELRKLDQMRELFIANVSHELKTPLTAIQGYLEAILDGMLKSEAEQRDYLERILKESKRMDTLVKEILTLSKLQSDQLKFSYQRLNLNDLIKELLTDFRSRTDVEINYHFKTEVELVTDKNMLKKVLTNLLSNAIKFTSNQGRVDIKLSLAEQMVEIEIKDNGVGIPSEELPYIWDRFHQVDRSRRPDVEGTGLGLAIVKEIIDALAGEVEVKSQVGVGSSFKVKLKI